MTLPLNHSKDRARLIANLWESYRIASRYHNYKLKAYILKKLTESEFNTQSTDSGG